MRDCRKYARLFMRIDQNHSRTVSVDEAQNLFQKSGLDEETLNRVLQLVGVDIVTVFEFPEFVLAMHLIGQARESNGLLPRSLPQELADFAASLIHMSPADLALEGSSRSASRSRSASPSPAAPTMAPDWVLPPEPPSRKTSVTFEQESAWEAPPTQPRWEAPPTQPPTFMDDAPQDLPPPTFCGFPNDEKPKKEKKGKHNDSDWNDYSGDSPGRGGGATTYSQTRTSDSAWKELYEARMQEVMYGRAEVVVTKGPRHYVPKSVAAEDRPLSTVSATNPFLNRIKPAFSDGHYKIGSGRYKAPEPALARPPPSEIELQQRMRWMSNATSQAKRYDPDPLTYVRRPSSPHMRMSGNRAERYVC